MPAFGATPGLKKKPEKDSTVVDGTTAGVYFGVQDRRVFRLLIILLIIRLLFFFTRRVDFIRLLRYRALLQTSSPTLSGSHTPPFVMHRCPNPTLNLS